MEKKITPLIMFPTEALVMNYRKHRVCRHDFWTHGTHKEYNRKLKKYTYWEAFYGPFEAEDGKTYNPVCLGYTMISEKEYYQKMTIITGDLLIADKYGFCRFTDEIEFNFEGMYWRGTIDEIKAELAKRPNITLKGGKEFRRWKQNYKKSRNH